MEWVLTSDWIIKSSEEEQDWFPKWFLYIAYPLIILCAQWKYICLLIDFYLLIIIIFGLIEIARPNFEINSFWFSLIFDSYGTILILIEVLQLDVMHLQLSTNSIFALSSFLTLLLVIELIILCCYCEICWTLNQT